VFIRQFHHGLVQSSLQLGQVCFAHRTARGRALQELLVVLNAGIDVIEAQLKTPSAFLQKIERHIHSNGMNPCVKGRFAAEPADCAVRFGENILQKIVRVLVVRGHVVHQAVKTRGVFNDQFIESAGIARLRTLYQLLIWIHPWLVHCLASRLSTSPETGRQQIRNPSSR
jgi:hypothetical protein